VKCVQDEHPPLPKGISKDLEDFLLMCFQKNRDNRASARDLLSHAWFDQLKEFDERKSEDKERLGPKFSGLRDTIKDEPSLPASSRIRVFGESIRPDAQYKAVFIANTTTSEEVIQVVLDKYNSKDDPSLYALDVEDTKSGGQFFFFFFFFFLPPEFLTHMSLSQHREFSKTAKF